MYIERHFRIWQVAFAAIDEVAKLQYVLSIKEIPTVEGRNAELSVLSLLALLVQKYKYLRRRRCRCGEGDRMRLSKYC